MNMKIPALVLSLLTASLLIPPGSATLPTADQIVWTGGTAITATGTTNIAVVDADTDGEKVGFVYQSVVTSSYGCRFVYGDINGWTQSVINATANDCVSVKFITGDTWVSLFHMSNNTLYIANTTNNGATWTTRSSVTGPSIGNPISGEINRYRFFVHSPTFFTILPSAGTSSGLYFTTDGGFNWANGLGGACTASNGFNGATDIEHPLAYTGSTLTYAYGAGTGMITFSSSGSCSAPQPYTFPLPQSGTGVAITSVGTVHWNSVQTSCSGPLKAVFTVPCRTIFAESTSLDPSSVSIKSGGGIGVFQFPFTTGGGGANMVFYDSESYVKSNITSLVFSAINNACGLTMAGPNVYCIYKGSELTTAKFITTAISIDDVNEPEDFGTGLAGFMAGLGFITPESQFFFALILIALTAVLLSVLLKFMGSGRTKMIVVSSTTMLVGIFCVVLSLFDLWMYTLGLVLGVFIVRGSHDSKNTFFELKKFVQEKIGKGSGEGEPEEVEKYVQSNQGPLSKVTGEEVDDYIEPIDGYDSPEPTLSEVDDIGSRVDTIEGTSSPGSDVSEV